MSKTKKRYAEIISQVQVMATGLKNNREAVAKRGIDADFVAELEKNHAEAIAMNDEQERLKAALKLQTEMLNAKMDAVYFKLSEARKVVKLSVPQSQWLEFGISDKR